MINKISFILLGILMFNGILKSQTSEYSDSLYTLGFSTYLSHTDKYAANFDIYSDSEGYTYISGNTRDKNFSVTEGAFQTEIKGEADAFVAKFTPEGEIVFATLIGGVKREHHTALTVDELGNIYLAGGTHSSDFPVTREAYDTSFNGEGEWAGDVFLTKINPTGSDIIFSTFIGGEVEETVSSGNIKIDSKGNIVIAGTTCSTDFPSTKGVIKNEYTEQDCFIAKFSPNGEALMFSTSLGKGYMDMVTGVDVDDKDNIYLTGYTYNRTESMPVTDDAIRKEIVRPTVGGFEDGIDHFVAKINETGTEVLYFSFIAAGGHMGSSICWSAPNKLMVSGSSKEEGFPTTENAICRSNIGERDCFVSIFNSEDMALEYSTLIGGKEADNITNSYFLDENTIVIGGKTCSQDFPLTENAMYSEYPVSEKTFNSTFFGRRKSFISVIDIEKGELIYSTFLGGCFKFKICPDKMGNISYVAEAGQRGEAGATGFPVTENAIEEPPTYIMLGRIVLNNSRVLE